MLYFVISYMFLGLSLTVNALPVKDVPGKAENIDIQAKFKESLTWARENAANIQAQLEAQLEQQKDKEGGLKQGRNMCKVSVGQVPCTHNTLTAREEKQGIPSKRDEKLLIFVSFSMPRIALNALADMAHHYHAVLVLRGLVDNSFQKTADVLKDFKEGLEINPELFKTYQITKVPTFILLKEGKEQNRLSGNVSLSFAYQKLKERS